MTPIYITHRPTTTMTDWADWTHTDNHAMTVEFGSPITKFDDLKNSCCDVQLYDSVHGGDK